MAQNNQQASASVSLTATAVADSPKVVFLPFSERLLKNSAAHVACWEDAANSSALRTANYPVSAAQMGMVSIRNTAGADCTGPMTLVPYDQQAMSFSILRNNRWEAL